MKHLVMVIEDEEALALLLKYNLENVTVITLSHLIPTASRAQRLYVKMGHSMI